MTDPIKAGFDVAFEYPGGVMIVVAQNLVTLIQGVGTTTLIAEAVGVGIGNRLLDRVQTEQVVFWLSRIWKNAPFGLA
jgi:hypothetical protein